LRQDYVKNKLNILSNNENDIIKIGDMSLIKELKLANDNLRWRLNQKTKIIESNNEIIENLKNSCFDFKKKYEDLKIEMDNRNIILKKFFFFCFLKKHYYYFFICFFFEFLIFFMYVFFVFFN
jgi:calcineurin-like phosphoesterase family protein